MSLGNDSDSLFVIIIRIMITLFSDASLQSWQRAGSKAKLLADLAIVFGKSFVLNDEISAELVIYGVKTVIVRPCGLLYIGRKQAL